MTLREIIGLVIIVVLIIFSIVMYFLGIRQRKIVADKEIRSEESEAKKLVLQGEKNAEERKREILIEAKEEIHKSRIEMERDLKERRKEIQRMESRVIQKEESLDKKIASMESKEEVLNKKMSDIDSKQRDIEQIHQDKLTELERISALTVEEAQALIKEGHFAPGSMLPKVEAAVEFASSRQNRRALITLLEKARDALDGKTGTIIEAQKSEH